MPDRHRFICINVYVGPAGRLQPGRARRSTQPIAARSRAAGIGDVMAGEVFAFEINQVFLLGISIYVALPALTVVLSLTLKASFNRWSNIVLGGIYAATILLSTTGEEYVYYVFLSVLEVTIALLIVWYAWKWPEQSTASITSGRGPVSRCARAR